MYLWKKIENGETGVVYYEIRGRWRKRTTVNKFNNSVFYLKLVAGEGIFIKGQIGGRIGELSVGFFKVEIVVPDHHGASFIGWLDDDVITRL